MTFFIALATFILGVATGISIFEFDRMTRETQKPKPIYYEFSKTGFITILTFDGKEYIPRKWFDDACHALFRKAEK